MTGNRERRKKGFEVAEWVGDTLTGLTRVT